MCCHGFACVLEIGGVIGAEAQARVDAGARGERRENFGLDEPVFVVAAFWPRIGEQDENIRKGHMGRQRGEEFARLGLEEREMRFESGAGGLAAGARDAFTDEVDADAKRRLWPPLGG